jgi:hypothetical protein
MKASEPTTDISAPPRASLRYLHIGWGSMALACSAIVGIAAYKFGTLNFAAIATVQGAAGAFGIYLGYTQPRQPRGAGASSSK